MAPVEISADLNCFITTEILRDPSRCLRADEPLISSGLIDSFSLVDLALHVEESFGVHLDDTELTAAVFDTVAELTSLIQQRAGAISCLPRSQVCCAR